MRRTLAWSLVAVVLLAAGAFAGGGWYYSGQLLEVSAPAERWERSAARLDPSTDDPAEALGLPVDTIAVRGELGELSAWRVVPSGADRTGPWIVFVHGRGATKAEGNSILAVASELGLPAISIELRGDPDAPAAPDGFGRYGDTEWRDLQAAIEHLEEIEEAQGFVLVGARHGGSVVLTFLRRSPDAAMIDAAVLITPLISLDASLELQAEQHGVPGPLVGPLLTATRWMSDRRADLDLDRLDHLEAVDELPAGLPLLVTDGDDDHTVPVEPIRRFARALPEQVTYVELEGADAAGAESTDDPRVAEHLRTFLSEVVDDEASRERPSHR